MNKSLEFMSGKDKSIAERYRLFSPETEELLNDAVNVTSKMFDGTVATVMLNDAAEIWSSNQSHCTKQASLLKISDHITQSNQMVELFGSDLSILIDAPIAVSNFKQVRYVAGLPLVLADGTCLGCLCLLKQSTDGLTSQQKVILRILAKDLVSQLELRQKNAQLENLTEFYELIIETNQDFVFVKDKEFKIVLANRAFLGLYPDDMQDKVIGYTTLESYREEEVTEFLHNDKLAFHTGKSDVIEKINFPNGEAILINTVKSRFFDHSGEPFILGVCRDVTERETLIEKLKKSNDDLDEFADIASHDLKSPLNAIKQLVSFIEEDAVDGFDEVTTKHFQMIKGRTDRMLKLLTDLLSFSRIGCDSQKFELLDLASVCKSCLGLLDIPDSFNLNVESQHVFLPKIPLELVLTNLISNAIKHHNCDTGNISISSQEMSEYYQIVVEDDGPGIPKLMYNKVFQKFQTLKSKDQVQGSGLGLSMVLKSVEYYDGSIMISESDMGGAKFTIKWPKSAADCSTTKHQT